MKKDTISKLIAFFKTNDKELLNNPPVLKKKFLDVYGIDYQPEISVFCKICSIFVQKKICNPDKDYIIYLGQNLSREHNIKENHAVMLLGCYAYIKQLITIDNLKELSLYKQEKEDIPDTNRPNNIHQNKNTGNQTYSGTNVVDPNDASSTGFAVLSFFFPLVGLILWLVWLDSSPKKAKSCGIGALVGVIGVPIIIIVLAIVIPTLLFITIRVFGG